MDKVKLGPKTLVYPMPSFLVGADVAGKPNFMAVAWGGIVGEKPPMICVAIRPYRHTMKGINETGVFSVNIPNEDQVVEADFCGIESGAKYDKTAICGFKVFYGDLKHAPMIEQCPVNLECKLEHSINVGSHLLLVGSISETFVSGDCLTEGKPDVAKIRPFVYSVGLRGEYIGLGKTLAPAFNAGRQLKPEAGNC